MTICRDCHYIFNETFGVHSETRCSARQKAQKFVRTKNLLSKSDSDWAEEYVMRTLAIKFYESKESIKWHGHRSCPVLHFKRRFSAKTMTLVRIPANQEIVFTDSQIQLDDIIALDEKLR